MASRGFLWVGTDFGLVLNFQLPRLRDGVPLIHGRPNVCYHSHNGPVKFLIPIYCGTVNTWDRAKALDVSATIREEKSHAQKEKTKDKIEQERRNSVNVEAVLSAAERKEREFAGKSTPLDIQMFNRKQKENGDSSSTKSSESDELLGGSYEVVYGIKRFRSLENLDTDTKQNFRDIHSSCVNTMGRNKPLTFRRELAKKLQARQNGTEAENTPEREISLYYGDLLHDNIDSPENLKSDSQTRLNADLEMNSDVTSKNDNKKSVKVYRQKPVEIPITSSMKYEVPPTRADIAAGSKLSQSPDKPEKSKMANVRKSLSFQFKNLRKSSQELYKSASLRVNPSANPRYMTLNTIQRRNCNAVVVVSGGDGYTDWRLPPKDSPKHNDASLMFWMYKF